MEKSLLKKNQIPSVSNKHQTKMPSNNCATKGALSIKKDAPVERKMQELRQRSKKMRDK